MVPWVLIGSKPPSATTVAATVDSSSGHVTTTSATAEITATAASPKTAATAATRHAGNVCSLGDDLDVTSLEDALVEDKGLCDQAGLGELDVCVSGEKKLCVSRYSLIASA